MPKSPSQRKYWITPCALLECQVAEKSRKLKPTTILFFYKGKIFETTDAQLCCVDQADKGKKIGLCTETTLTTLSCIFFSAYALLLSLPIHESKQCTLL